MSQTESSAVELLPEYLKKERDYSNSATEILEKLDPNSANISAALVDKIVSDLPEFNTWSEYDDYSKEFKFGEVFANLDPSIYSIKKTELLKGFFSFKGTLIDIRYLTKIAGYDLSIFEPRYYQNNRNPYKILIRDYWDDLQHIITGISEDSFNNGILKVLYSDVIVVDGVAHLLINDQGAHHILNDFPDKVNNIDPYKIRNQAAYIDANGDVIFPNEYNTPLYAEYNGVTELTSIIKTRLIFDTLDLTFEDIKKIETISNLYEEVVDKTDDELNCQVTAELYIDLDSSPKCNKVTDYTVEIPTETGTDNKLLKDDSDYECFRTEPVLKLIRNVIAERISLCVYLSKLSTFFHMHSFVEIMRMMEEFNSIDLTRETYTMYERDRVTTPIEEIDLYIEPDAHEASDCGNWPIAVGAYAHHRVVNVNPNSIRGEIDREVLVADDIHMARETVDTRTDNSYDATEAHMTRNAYDYLKGKEATFVDYRLIVNASPEIIPGTSTQNHNQYDFSTIDLTRETLSGIEPGNEYITGIGNPVEYRVDNNQSYKVRGKNTHINNILEEHLNLVERTKQITLKAFENVMFIGSTIILNKDTTQYEMIVRNRASIEHNELILVASL